MAILKILQFFALGLGVFYCGSGLKIQKATEQLIKSGVRGGQPQTEYIVSLKSKGKKAIEIKKIWIKKDGVYYTPKFNVMDAAVKKTMATVPANEVFTVVARLRKMDKAMDLPSGFDGTMKIDYTLAEEAKSILVKKLTTLDAKKLRGR
ncbi:MAG: hypothetical protein GY810_02625 [Aureispira sp.]|nr:hypothetical protein [Aureispira sp.]